MNISLKLLLFTLLCTFLSSTVIGQEKRQEFTSLMTQLDSYEQRPKIGLALSGGAAHGLAHIGVIKYLEEQGIEFDYITGTSMGSIVGGLLAVGYNSDQLTRIASTQNWNLILSNNEPLDEIAYSEKFYQDKFPLQLVYDKKAISLPKGFLAGQKMDMLISRLYSPAYKITDFDDLPIPFRCFAVDIVTGEVVTLDKGYLGRAIRASMAIPSVFTPVDQDEKLLVDGGLIRNFPVENNFEMGADLVIGVYVGSVLEDKEKLSSLFSILKQSAMMLSIKDSELQKEMCSLYIEPPTKDIDSFGFEDYEELIRRGYEEAKKYEVEIKAIAEVLNNYKRIKARPTLKYQDPIKIDKIRTTETAAPFDGLITSRLNFSEGDIVSFNRLEQNISSIYGTKNFDNIAYSILKEDKYNILDIHAAHKEFIELGANVNHFYSSNSSIILNAQVRNKLMQLSNLELTARLSQNPAGSFDFKRRFGNKHSNIIGIDGLFETYNVPLIINDVLLGEYTHMDTRSHIKYHSEFGNNFMLGARLSNSKEMMDRNIKRPEDFSKYEQDEFALGLTQNYNSLDNRYFPHKGTKLEVNVDYHFNRDIKISFPDEINNINDDGIANYFTASISFLEAYKLSQSLVSNFSISAYYSTEAVPLAHTGIGGTFNAKPNNIAFIGADEMQFNLSKAVVARQSLFICPNEYIYLGVTANFLYGRDYYATFLEPDANHEDGGFSKFGYGVTMGLITPVGPLIIDVGMMDGKLDSSIGIGHRYFF